MKPRRPWQTRQRTAPRKRPRGYQLLAGTTRLAVSASEAKLRDLAAWLVSTGTPCEVTPFAGGVAEVDP